jgi:hypothetical protein
MPPLTTLELVLLLVMLSLIWAPFALVLVLAVLASGD